MTGPDFSSIVTPPAWMVGAVCDQVDPEWFYPEKGGSTKEAKAVCAGCPVRPECLAYAVGRGERHGIWGGSSERERRAMRRRGGSGVAA